MGRFQYEPISRDADIRVLRIHAGSNGDIICELKPISFGSASYLALSYVWGKYEAPATMSKIHIQKAIGSSSIITALAVRSNLYAALKQLRHPTKDVDCWADAVCIDFENEEERELQLALMQSIYQRAERVLHWLGREEHYTLDAFRCVRLLRTSGFEKDLSVEHYEQLRCFQQLLSNIWFRRRWIIQEVAFARTAILFSGPYSVYWSVFAEAASAYFVFQDSTKTLTSHDWPTRQQAACSTQAARVLINVTCNISRKYHTQPWEKLHSLQREEHDRGQFPKQEDTQPEARNTIDLSEGERALIEEYEAGQTKEYRLTLEQLVDVLHTHEVSDYRDTIYAVLSLAKDTNRGQLSTPTNLWEDSDSSAKTYHNIQPDYGKDVFEVFKDFTEYCTQRNSMYPLDIICRPWVPSSIKWMFSDSDRETGSPIEPHPLEALAMEKMRWLYERRLASWMPTTKELAFDYTQSYERKNGDCLVGGPDCPIYSATKCFKTETRFGESKAKHKRSKRESGDVSQVIPSAISKRVSDGTLHAKGIQLDIIETLTMPYHGIITENWLLMGGWSGRRFRWMGQQTIPDAFWRTMVADRDDSGTSFKPDFREACKQAVIARDEHNNIHTHLLINQRSGALNQFLKRVNDVAWNRRLFRTKTMKRLGLAPVYAAERDVICVLYGCSVPVVLRAIKDKKGKDTGEYELIGECYLDGMMDGQAVSESRQEQARKDGSEKVFILR